METGVENFLGDVKLFHQNRLETRLKNKLDKFINASEKKY